MNSGRMVSARRVLTAVLGLVMVMVPLVTASGEAPASASLIDGYTPNLPCTINTFADFLGNMAVDDSYDRDAVSVQPPLTFGLSVPKDSGILVNDYNQNPADGPGGPLEDGTKVAIATGPSHAKTFDVKDDGSFTYVPQDGYYGADQFTYVTYLNNGQCSNVATVSLAAMNRVRTMNDTYRTTMDAKLSVGRTVCGLGCGVLDNDVFTNPMFLIRANTFVDVAGDSSTGEIYSLGGTQRSIALAHGDLVIYPNGSFEYTPDAGFQGTDGFYYTVKGFGVSSLQTGIGGVTRQARKSEEFITQFFTVNVSEVTIEVGPAPLPNTPNGTADDVAATEDATTVILASDLRANDPLASFITLTSNMINGTGQRFVPTSHGMLELTWKYLVPGDLTSPEYIYAFAYTPKPGYFGPDDFFYFVRTEFESGLAGLSEAIPVTIHVANVDDPPTPSADTAVTDEDTPITLDLAGNDTDADGDLARNTVAADPCTDHACTPANWSSLRHGSWVANGDGTVTYTPDNDYVGPATYLYQIADARGALGYASATVEVQQNDAVDDQYTTAEGTTLVVGAPGVLANDEGAATSATLVDPPVGTLALQSNGSFTYTPPADKNGKDSFTYRAGGELAMVTIHVTPVPDSPQLALNAGCNNNGGTSPTGSLLVCDPSWDDRDVLPGETAFVRGSISDVDGPSGELLVNWGDGVVQTLPYPCTGVSCTVQINRDQCWQQFTCDRNVVYFVLTHTFAADPTGPDDFVRFSVTAFEPDTGLGDSKSGYIQVRGIPAPPQPPTGVAATVADADSVSVSFVQPSIDGGSWISGYRVTCTSPTGVDGAATGAASPLTVTGLTTGATYTCVAAAQNSTGWSDDSAPSSPVVLQKAPDAPTGVVATLSGYTAISVEYAAPASDGGSPITGYRATCSSPTATTKSVTGPSSPLLVSSLKAGATYTCVVTAKNDLAWGTDSAPATPVRVPATPSAPTDAVATVSGNGLAVAFTPPADDGGLPITSYQVACTSIVNIRVANGTASPIVVPNLASGASYDCQVTAVNDLGYGASSNPSATVTMPVVPGPPTGVTASLSGPDGLSVAFVPPVDSGGSPISGYAATCSSPSGATKSATGTSSPIVVAGLTAGASYTCVVTASNDGGPGPSSASSAAVVMVSVPGAPTAVAATLSGVSGLSVAFTAPASDGGSAITGYTATCSSPTGTTRSISGTLSPLVVPGLTAGASYTCTVVARNVAGPGPASSPSTPVVTPTVPGEPTGVTAALSGVNGLSVAFTAPASNGGSAITSYTATCSSPAGATKAASGPASPLIVGGLTAGASYTCVVVATNAVGPGPSSAPSTAVTMLNVPGPPTKVAAATLLPGTAGVAFRAPASNGGATITGYRATCTSPAGTQRTATGGSSPLVVTGLTAGATYTCVVAASNAVGWSADSAPSGPVLMPNVPGAPTNVVAAASGSRELRVSFRQPASNGGTIILQYRAQCTSPTGVTKSASGGSSPLTVSGLTAGATYTCTVVAVNLVGPGAASAPSAPVVVRGGR